MRRCLVILGVIPPEQPVFTGGYDIDETAVIDGFMFDDALSGKFDAQGYDESLLSKIESKIAFLDSIRQGGFFGTEPAYEKISTLSPLLVSPCNSCLSG